MSDGSGFLSALKYLAPIILLQVSIEFSCRKNTLGTK